MANITINEISQTYTYTIGANSYATVALPITACWGPGFIDPATSGKTLDQIMEETSWSHFPATRAGLEAFVSTYRGPASNYRLASDYSYQMAMTLLSSGYDVLVCRLCPGGKASGSIEGFGTYSKVTTQPSDWSTKWKDYFIKDAKGEYVPVPGETVPTFSDYTVYQFSLLDSSVSITAKYPGSFGNNLECILTKVLNRNYWRLVTYVVDTSGIKTAVENLTFVFDVENSTDAILHYREVSSNFIDIEVEGTIDDTAVVPESNAVQLTGGDDKPAVQDGQTPTSTIVEALALAKTRFGLAVGEDNEYTTAMSQLKKEDEGEEKIDLSKALTIYYREWIFNNLVGTDANIGGVYDILKDKFTYRAQRVISPWDDMDTKFLDDSMLETAPSAPTPIHAKLMDVAYNSRCSTACIDIPHSLPRSLVYNESGSNPGYAQVLARSAGADALYSTHSALFAPWGQYTYVGTSRPAPANPSFLGLMIQRAMILNQAIQYEWALPTNRKHNLVIGKLDYKVSKKLLDEWQTLEGVGVNIITELPDLGIGLWGNSTLYEVPPATYQALANLSTRYLVNAIEDTVYRIGLQITWQYNNEQAYSSFYAGVTPILDTMKNVGAIEQYKVQMSSAIDGLDSVNANTVVGKILITVNGVINDIIVDLVALPSSVDLEGFGE